MPLPHARAQVLAILAEYGGRSAEQIPEQIDSMELAWLLHRLGLRYGRSLDDDALLARMETVQGVAGVLVELGLEPDTAPGSAAPSGADGARD